MKNRRDESLGADRELTPLSAAPLGDGPVPQRLLIVPWGRVESSNGAFVVDEESARLAVERFEAHGCDLPIDYEHQTLGGAYASPTGQAPAAGWVKKLEAVPGEGLFAHVHWTEPANRQLCDRQYRYLSPVAIVRKSDAKLVALHSVALTNKPAIAGMTPIVNRQPADADPAVAQPDQAVAFQEAAVDLCRQLALGEDSSEVEVLIAAGRRLAELEEQRCRQEAEQRVAKVLAEGRLAPVQRDWAVRLCLTDAELFEEFVRTSVAVVRTGRLEPPESTGTDQSQVAVAARARAEYRANPALAGITSEEAFVAQAVRTACVA